MLVSLTRESEKATAHLISKERGREREKVDECKLLRVSKFINCIFTGDLFMHYP